MILTPNTNKLLITRTAVLSMLLFVFCCFSSLAQSFHGNDVRNMFRFSHLSAADGLAGQRVFSIVEGNDHAIWIATKNGVERYNGVTMMTYNLDLDTKNYNEAASRIIRLYKSAKGELFAFTNSGKIFRFDDISNTFILVFDAAKLFSSEIILNDISFSGNKFWLALNSGLYNYQQGGKPKAIIRNTFVNDLMETSRGLYVGTNSGLFYADFTKSSAQLLFPNMQVQSSYYDTTTNKVFIGTFNSGLLLGDVATRKLYPEAPEVPHKPVRAITPLNDKTMLVGIDGGGVAGIERLTGRLQFILSTDDETGAVLHGNGIYDICRDEWGDIWIGSYSGGVDIVYAVDNALQIVGHEYLNSQSLFNSNVNAIMEDDNGNIYYATDRGVSTYNTISNTWTHSIPGMVCLNLARDINGRIIVATYGGGVRTIDGAEVYTKENGKLKTNYVFSLFNDGRGNLWIGCLDGDLACVSTSGQRYFPIQNVQSIKEMPDGRVAIATANGFYAIDSKGNQAHYFESGEFHSSSVNIYVTSMLFTSPNEVWLGTDGGGVYIYNMRLHSCRQLTTKNGLPSNSVMGIVRDNKNRIWVTTDHGLVYILQKPKIKIVAVELPYGGLEFNRDATATLPDGRLALGSTMGALLIRPDEVMEANYKAPVHLCDIIVSGLDGDEARELRPKIFDMLGKDKVTLPYSHNTFTLIFESINLKYQYDITYQYYIEGQNDDALQKVDDGRILFNSLSPGTYRIHLRSVSRSTGRIISERVLELKISHPWWNSPLAWLVYICLFITIIYATWRVYRGRLQGEYDAERINFFVNTAHEIRTPLSLTLAPLDDIAHDGSLSEASRGYLDIARRNGKQLMTLITTLLDFQKANKRNIRLHIKQLDLRSLLEQACSQFNLISEQKHITLSLESCPENATVWMDEGAAKRILGNLISNAIKYTRENGKVAVGATVDEQHVVIYVRDNGIGIPEKSKRKIFSNFFRAENALRTKITGSGLGLMLVKRLVTLQHGTVSFESKEGEGSTFFVTMPKGFDKQMDILQAADSQESTDENNSDKTVMLFVDDNAELRNYMKLAFGNEYDVITKSGAQEALDYLATNTCDIIISDVMMPGMQGDEFCRRVKENEATSFIPVILLTAKVGNDYTIEGLNCGADDYMPKPFETSVLKAKVESLLRNRQAVREYFLRRAASMAQGTANDSSSKTDDKTSTAKTPAEENTTAPQQPKEEPVPVQLSEDDKDFIDNATQKVLENMHDEDFDINALCREMAMSRTLFYNRLKALTGHTPQDFIRMLRLEHAAKLIDEGASVFEASTDTGFANVKYFSTLFKKHFGVSPSKYHKE